MTGAPASPERPRLATLGAARADARFADAERHRRRVKRLKIALPLLAIAWMARWHDQLFPEPMAEHPG